MIGIAGLGFLVALGMKSLTLATETDEAWGLHDVEKEKQGKTAV
jgi:hypothetical protein